MLKISVSIAPFKNDVFLAIEEPLIADERTLKIPLEILLSNTTGIFSLLIFFEFNFFIALFDATFPILSALVISSKNLWLVNS